MIELPDPQHAYDYENQFYLTAQPGRVGKLISHYELYKIAKSVPGALVECGVFKGASFLRFAAFRNILESSESREMIAFDIWSFGDFCG